jgi:hypothetical protein
VNYEIVELEPYSGSEARIYSLIPMGENETLFENFVDEYKAECRNEIKQILKTIYQIGHTTGARSSFFKHHEGKYGDFVCALFDVPDKNLRVYCIRFGMVAVILGGGGEKGEGVRAWQDDEKLSKEANLMIEYAKDILKRLDDGDLYWSKDRTELQGNLKNYDNEYN